MDTAEWLREAVRKKFEEFQSQQPYGARSERDFTDRHGLPAHSIHGFLDKSKSRYVPRIDKAEDICRALGFEFYIGEPRPKPTAHEVIPQIAAERLVDIALAEAGPRIAADAKLAAVHPGPVSIMGWAPTVDTPERTLPAPGDIDDADAFWAGAHGTSMMPEGIRPGDWCLISPAKPLRAGQRVWLRDVEGASSIKRLLALSPEGYRLRGWYTADPQTNRQHEFTEERLRSGITQIGPVLRVHRGKPTPDALPRWVADPLRQPPAPDWLRAALRLESDASAEEALVAIAKLYAAARRADPNLEMPPLLPRATRAPSVET